MSRRMVIAVFADQAQARPIGWIDQDGRVTPHASEARIYRYGPGIQNTVAMVQRWNRHAEQFGSLAPTYGLEQLGP